jgi:hypothetical protein
MNNVRLDPAPAQPPREPEAITARLEGNGDAPDRATGLDRLIPPALQQSEQRCFVRLQLLQRMTANARHDACDQPAGLTHFDDRHQCTILLKGGEGSAQVVRLRLRHGVLSVGVSSDDAATISSSPAHSFWEAWTRRDLAQEDIVRLVLDGSVVRVRLDRKATNISLLVVLGIRRDGQKILLAVRNMGGESEAAWRGVLDNLVARGLKDPEFLIIDGAAGLEKALAAL